MKNRIFIYFTWGYMFIDHIFYRLFIREQILLHK